MKKNYFFGKAIAGMAILFSVTWGFVSCGKTDNALEEIINSETPITFTVTKTSGTTAKTVILTPGNITDALKEVLADIMDAADAGEKYTLTIDASHLTIDASQISIPKIDGADIVLEFENLGNSDETLQFKASSTANNDGSPSATAINNLTIKLPASSTQDLDINLPDTHVELEGGYGTVNAVTALSTLVVKNGATIQFLHINFEGEKQSPVLVKDGGKIEALLFYAGEEFRTNTVFTNDAGDEFNWGYDDGRNITTFLGYGINAMSQMGNNEFVIRDENGKPYFIKSVKVIKGNGGNGLFDNKYALANLQQSYTQTGDWSDYELATIDKLIIGDGAAVILNHGANVKEIIGEGDGTGTLYYGSIEYTREEGQITGISDYSNNGDLYGIGKISNVIFKPVTDSGYGEFAAPAEVDRPQDPGPEANDDERNAYNQQNDAYNAYINKIHAQIQNMANMENCTINCDNIQLPVEDEGISITNCTFKTWSDWDNYKIWHMFNGVDENEVITYAVSFKDCKFDQKLSFGVSYWSIFAAGSSIKFTFNGCEYSDDFFSSDGFNIFNDPPLRFDIDGTLKKLEWDGDQNKWNMVNAAD